MPISPAPSPLTKDIHRDGRKHHRRRDAANNKEAVPHTLDHDPVIRVKGQAEGKHVLDKIHDGKGLGRLLAVAVDDVGHHAGRAELDAEVDQTQAHDDGHGPRVLGVEGLSPGEEADGCEDEVCGHDWEAELRLWDSYQ